MKITYTHILVEFGSQDQEILYRFADGVRLGQRKGPMVVFGENPHKNEGRTFIDAEHAKKYLRVHLTGEDLKASNSELPVQLDIRQGEGAIVLPAGAMELPGGIRNFN